jgi:1-acyl-sn-glycerol-3-phosphate acyltransferase
MWLSNSLIGVVRLLVGATPRWVGATAADTQRIYFANHSSHIDTVALWSALPPELRIKTRPVAAADYWGTGRLKRYVALRALNAVLINRTKTKLGTNPLSPLFDALDQGDSLILFPEGTRQQQALPGNFKAGLFHLAERYPHVELVPVYLENLHRCMPKGTLFPVPIICTVRFGTPMQRIPNEDKPSFLTRARDAVIGAAQ